MDINELLSTSVPTRSATRRDAIDHILDTLLGHRHFPDLATRSGQPRNKYSRSQRRDDSVLPPVPGHPSQPARIAVLDRPSPLTLIVFWSDAQSGHYANQIWRLTRSPARAFCVLTGAPIREGDKVFRPTNRGTCCPGNRDAMIRADAITADLRSLASSSMRDTI